MTELSTDHWENLSPSAPAYTVIRATEVFGKSYAWVKYIDGTLELVADPKGNLRRWMGGKP
jgi:CRISPR/Cas system-associated protein endoribonuclease Cas2